MQDLLRFHCYTAGEYYLAIGPRLEVDTCYRKFQLPVNAVVGRWGLDACSLATRRAYANGDYDQLVSIVHAVEPRPERDPKRIGAKNKPWRSVYFEETGDRDQLLGEGGFDVFPLLTPRWDVVSTDVYGRGPAADALGDSRQLQQQERRKAQLLDKQVNPPLVAPSSLRSGTVSTLPGGITWHDELQGQAVVRPLYEIRHGIGEITVDMDRVQDRIHRAWYADIFQAILRHQGESPEKTAAEIAEIASEKFVSLGDVLERLYSELLTPLIDLTFARMLPSGDVPAPPEEIQGQQLKVRFISPLALAQQYQTLQAVDQLLTRATAVASVYPDVVDKVDWDQAMDEVSGILGVPPGVVRSDDQVAEIRSARQQQQAALNMVAAAQPMARAAKDLSEADPQAVNDFLGAQPPAAPIPAEGA